MDKPPPFKPGAHPAVPSTVPVEGVPGLRVIGSDWEKAKTAAKESLEKMKVVGGEDQA